MRHTARKLRGEICIFAVQHRLSVIAEGMEDLFARLSPSHLATASSIAVPAGVVKGVVGNAMPMLVISGLSTVLDPSLARAGLVFD
jgi:F420-0:gamma-glutamyl ligase